jgi:RHS repeat-associated protein
VYDAAGNELQYLATRSYSPRNFLESVTDSGELPWEARRIEYRYDGRGIRVARSELQPDGSKATRHYTYSPELNLLAVTGDDASNVWNTGVLPGAQQFVWFNGRPLAQIAPDFPGFGPRWYFNDHLGTPLVQTNAAANMVWQAEYEPYGDVWAMRTPAESEESQSAAVEQPLRFPGQEAAMKWEGTEERYNVFRWYRSRFARYTQADPLESPQFWTTNAQAVAGISTYAYSLNNPLTTTDTLGLAPVKNESPVGAFWYKPENCNTTPCPIKACGPGDTCDVDGIYPPGCKSNPYKIVNGCSGKINAKGKLIVTCSLVGKAAGIFKGLGADGYGQVDDDFMKEHKDWAPPNQAPPCVKKNVCNN